MLVAALQLLLPLSLGGCGSTLYAARPYRFDAPSSVPQETARIAQRMSSDSALVPALVDTSRGLVYAKWRMTGVSASLRFWPPGERRAWRVERYRVLVRPNGWASTVFVELERVECDTRGFGWTALELHGDCTPIPGLTSAELAALDAKAATLVR